MDNYKYRARDIWDLAKENANRNAERGRNRRRLIEILHLKEKIINGKECLSFSESDYLGISNHPNVIQAYKKGIDKYGCLSSPALMSGFTAAHAALEEELSAFLGLPRVVLFISGYIANLGVISAIMGATDHVIHDRLNHLSLLDASFLSGAKMHRYAHRNLNNLKSSLNKINDNGRRLVITDGVFSMDGVIADLSQIASIAKEHNAWLMVDDAHGLGHIGKNGGGSLEYFNLNASDVQILMGCFSKGFGTSGGFIAGGEDLIELLINASHPYLCSSTLPAAVAEATRASLNIIQTESWRRESLLSLIKQFKLGAKHLGYDTGDSETAIQPIFLGSSEKALKFSIQLMEKGIYVPPIRFPIVPEGTARIRVSINVDHTPENINQLLSAIEEMK